MDALFGLFWLMVIFCLYFMPAIIGRDKKHSEGITLLNLFLGWTFFGWVGALIWAVSSEKKN